jgi:tRNA A-37 threonylcarbamoyl transferase component Bud32
MSSPIAVGSVVADSYRITSQLGLGGMGSVWAAEHLRLPGKRVAIKVLHAALSSAEVLLRFRREAEIASRIGHPNIVEVLDFNSLPGGEPFLVMELLSGQSLAARLRRGRLPEKSALDIARQIGSALAAAHRLQVVHRDLKPDNIFLCPRDVDGELRDHVKVLDFGISKIRNAQTVLTQDASLMGTPYYMSPEQATGKNQDVDQRTDIFALGAIVFEMLTGQTAFPGDSLPSVIYQVVFQPHPALLQIAPTVHARVAAAVDRALAKNPADRFPDMPAFVEALTGRPLVTTAGPAGQAGVSAGAQDPALLGLEGTAPAWAPGPTAIAPTLPVAAASASPGLGATSLAPPTPKVASEPEPGRSSRRLWFAVAATAAVAVAAWWLARGRSGEPPVVVEPVAPPVVAETTRPAEPSPSPSARVAPDVAPVADTATEKSVQKTATSSRAVVRQEVLPGSVTAELNAAEKALAAKDLAEAIRRARHSLYGKKSSRASAILTRAFCMQGDLGAAKAELAHLRGAERARVIRACRAVGMDL